MPSCLPIRQSACQRSGASRRSPSHPRPRTAPARELAYCRRRERKVTPARLTGLLRSLKIFGVHPRELKICHPWSWKRASLAGLLLALLGVPAIASDYGRPLYQWSDEQGTIRYTPYPGEVPRSRRSSLQRVESITSIFAPPPSRSALPPVGAGLPSAATAASAVDEAVLQLDEEAAAIARLQASIARDKALLENLISDPETAASREESADLSTIAERLPRHQAELQALLERRGP